MKSTSPSLEDTTSKNDNDQVPSQSSKKPAGLRALIVVQLVMTAIAIPSGLVLLADPTGSVVGGALVLQRLKATIPFINDFTLVGLWLLVVYGISPVLLVLNLLRNRRWAWLLTIVLGGVEISWIVVELFFFYSLGFNPMYPLIGSIGIATLALALLPSLRKYYSTSHEVRSF